MTILDIPEKVEKKVDSGKPMYDQQYCKEHNQVYGDHLHRCPICVGEEVGNDFTMIKKTFEETPDQMEKVVNEIISKYSDSWGEYFTKFANSVVSSKKYKGELEHADP